MRDMPLVLNVPWGKKEDPLSMYAEAWVNRQARAERKKEKPRGNGARNKRKT